VKTLNQIITYRDYAEIVLHSKGVFYYCKIDIDDIDKFKRFHWCLSVDGYAYTQLTNEETKKQFNVKLHRMLMKNQLTEEKPFVDHINRDRLDNRKINLQICNRSENNHNITRQKNNLSGCTGVGWCKVMNKWRSRIYISGKEIRLGYFDNIEDAVNARLEAEKKYLGKIVAIHSMDENLRNVRR
jgi:hypothetical protein